MKSCFGLILTLAIATAPASLAGAEPDTANGWGPWPPPPLPNVGTDMAGRRNEVTPAQHSTGSHSIVVTDLPPRVASESTTSSLPHTNGWPGLAPREAPAVLPPRPGVESATNSLPHTDGWLGLAPGESPAFDTIGDSPGTVPNTSVFASGHGAARAPFDPADRFMAENQPKVLEELYDRVLDLQPDGNDRQLIQRVRTAVQQTEVGVDVSGEEWVTVRDATRITWGGRLEGDWVNWADDSQFGGQPNYFEFRRLRLSASGEGYGVYDYTLELEFAPDIEREVEVVNGRVELGGLGVELKDAYVGIRDIPCLGYLRFGHFKVPLSLSELTSSRSLPFLERSLAERLVPGREVGLAAHNRWVEQNASWGYGIFFDELDEAVHAIEDDNQGTRLVGRLAWAPYYDEPSEGRYLVHTGIGYAYTRPRKQDNAAAPGTEFRPVRFRARPEIHRGDFLIDTGDINTQQYHLVDAEMAWVHGPFSLQSELIGASLEEFGGQATQLYGAYVYASWFLTGEHRPYDPVFGTFDPVTPLENFFVVDTPHGACAGWGAWELAARWSYLDFSEVNDQQLNDLTLGINWYWNPHVRMMFNWIHPFAHNSPLNVANNGEGDIIAMRLQIGF